MPRRSRSRDADECAPILLDWLESDEDRTDGLDLDAAAIRATLPPALRERGMHGIRATRASLTAPRGDARRWRN